MPYLKAPLQPQQLAPMQTLRGLLRMGRGQTLDLSGKAPHQGATAAGPTGPPHPQWPRLHAREGQATNEDVRQVCVIHLYTNII